MVTKNRNYLITQNDSFGKNCGAKNFGILFLEKSFINWRVLSLVKINTRFSETPCIYSYSCVLQLCTEVSQVQ
jgi:hypothetical protein